MGRRRIIAWCVAAAAGAVVLEQLAPSLASSPSAPAPREAAAAAPASPSLEGLASLPARQPIAPSQGELFGPRSWEAPAAEAAGRSATRRAPPVPYRVAGQATYADGMRVVLAKEGRVFFVREGDTIEGGYRVQSIKPDAVTLVYLPLGVPARLKVSGAPLEVGGPALARRPADAGHVQAGSGGTAAR